MDELFSDPGAVPAGFARVAVARGVDRYPDGLTYAIPAAMGEVREGDRVVVPLGRGDTPTAGYVIDVVAGADDLDPRRVKEISRRESDGARLPGDLVSLARWISGYYFAPVGMALAAMMPAAVRRGIGSRTRVYVDLAAPPPEGVRTTAKQRAVIDVLTGLPAGERPIDADRLAELAGLRTTGPILRLVDAGALVASRRTSIEAAWSAQAVDTRVPESLTAPQQAIVDSIGAALGAGFSSHLLFGVTGSGKTEVYIRLIERVTAAGRVALVLVPEIALTPQTGGRLIGRFPDRRVAILHSALTAAQRHQQWAMVAAGDADVVIGARSAVFAPIPDGRLGLVVVDEEHDGSYKQDQVPRYHGRDVAIRRAQLAGCPVLLASATPSLESWHNATVRRRSALHRLADRAPGLRLPRVDVVDLVDERRRRMVDRGRAHLLGPTLERALREALHAGGQALLLLNRRGYASYIACPDARCGWLLGCDHCDARMVWHREHGLPAGGYVRCHHCLAEQRLPRSCPECGKRLTTLGLGTQRLEEELAAKFPELASSGAVMRLDSDSVRGGGELHAALARFGAGDVRVLLGTQMIAKGLDFPGVRLVGVINADTSLNMPDFRAAERTFQLVAQVAGRTGRGAEPGRAIVQSFQPDHPAVQCAAAHDYEAFARAELADREACRLPPVTRMARLVVRDADHERCEARARALVRDLRAAAGAAVRIDDPVPCAIPRIAGRHRREIIIVAPGATELHAALTAARRAGIVRSDAGLAVDVDPVALM